MNGWQEILVEPAKVILAQIGSFLVNALLVILILIIGWIIAKAIKTLVTRLLKAIKIDELSERIGLEDLLEKGSISYSFSELLGVIAYWLMLLVTFVVAVNAVGLTIAATLLNSVVLYIPNIIAAIFILILGMFVATILKNIVVTAANNAGLSHSKVLAKVVEVSTVVFAVIIALEQLGIGAKIIHLIISIMVASIGLAVALAFGLGCKGIAEKALSDFLDKLKKR
ncbi:hypothetical protein ACFLZ3_03525 [Candidatus Omnitrophota bacterium]